MAGDGRITRKGDRNAPGTAADWWRLRKRASSKAAGANERVIRKDGQTGKRTCHDW